jgi:hypothetical protein
MGPSWGGGIWSGQMALGCLVSFLLPCGLISGSHVSVIFSFLMDRGGDQDG